MVDLSTVDTVIFDLGGVVVNLDINRTIEAFEELGLSDIRSRITAGLHDGIFLKLELGEIGEEEFYKTIRSHTDNVLSNEAIKKAWCAMLLDLPLSRIKIIEQLKQTHQVYLLSNTNYIHHKYFDGFAEGYSSLSDLFHKVFYSYLMHDHKPNTSIFSSVVESVGLNVKKTVFVDDSIDNVLAAQSLGMQGVLITPERQMEDIF